VKPALFALVLFALPAVAERVLPVNAVVAEPASLLQTEQSLLGQIQAQDQATLAFELSGRVAQLMVREGAKVTQGQVLAQLDTDLIEQRVAQAQAELTRIQTQQALSRSTLKRLRNARAQGAITDQQIDEAQQKLAANDAALLAAQAQLATLSVEAAKHQLLAPFEGQITARHLSIGQVVAPGAPVFDLVTEQLRARIAIPQGMQVELGQPLELSQGSQRAQGRVYAWLPERDSVTAARHAWVEVEQGTGWVSGDWVRARLLQQQSVQGVWVPVQSLARDAAGWVVYQIDENERVQPQAVQVLHSDGTRALVQGQIIAGDTLVADGLHRIVPGLQVEVAKVVGP